VREVVFYGSGKWWLALKTLTHSDGKEHLINLSMTWDEQMKILERLEELLFREPLDTTDPETIAEIAELSAEIAAIRRRIENN